MARHLATKKSNELAFPELVIAFVIVGGLILGGLL